jgi:hypothetical protein
MNANAFLFGNVRNRLRRGRQQTSHVRCARCYLANIGARRVVTCFHMKIADLVSPCAS